MMSTKKRSGRSSTFRAKKNMKLDKKKTLKKTS